MAQGGAAAKGPHAATRTNALPSPSHPAATSLTTHRVLAPRRPPASTPHSSHPFPAALADRASGRPTPSARAALRAARFARLHLTASLDAAAPPDASLHPLHWARKRSPVVEVAAAGGCLLALTAAGGAAAFDAATGALLCHLNDAPDTVVRSLFVNRAAGDVVTVAVSRRDGYGALRCSAVSLSAIAAATPTTPPPPARPLFGGAGLRWPGFVEFDDVNGVAIAADADEGRYNITDLSTYAPRFTVPGDGVREVRTAPGVLLLVGDSHGGGSGAGEVARVPCRLVSIADGSPLASFDAPIPSGARVDFIELFAGSLLVGASPAGTSMACGGASSSPPPSLTLVDVATGAASPAPPSHPRLPPPSAFIFLHDARRCLAFGRDGSAAVLDGRGVRGADLSGVALAAPASPGGPAANSVYVTADQQYVVSYGRVPAPGKGRARSPSPPSAPRTPPGNGDDDATTPPPPDPTVGAITVSHVASGATIARLTAADAAAAGDTRAAAALDNVTALFYDEDSGAVITGGADGWVHVWSN